MAVTEDPAPEQKDAFTAPVDLEAAGGSDVEPEQIYTPQPFERQLTIRAVAMGCAIGSVVAAMNLYLGLRTGWSLGGSLIAAILGFVILGTITAILRKGGVKTTQYGVLETNITQTAGSAAGSMTSAAGLLAAIPAMGMLGFEFTYLELTLWALSVAYLGVFFAVPLRRQMVVAEKLRFPTGTATAETIVSMAGSGDEARRKAIALFLCAGLAGLYALSFYFVPELEHPPIEAAIAPLAMLTVWGFSPLLSPMMFGAGVLIGPRVGSSLLLGAVLAWGVIAPIIVANGLVAGPFIDADGVWQGGTLMSFSPLSSEAAQAMGAPESMVGLIGGRAWLLWPGVALMIADALMTLVLNWRSVLNTFLPGKGDADAVDHAPDVIPNLWWMGGLVLATILVTVMAWFLFEIPWYFTLIAVALSSVLAAIAVRSTGETDINPIGGMGKVTQLAFAGLSPGAVGTNLMAAAITGSGASQAGDMMQDLKTGYMLGASPRKQFLAQLVGIGAGILVCVPAYILFDSAYDIGGLNQTGDAPLKPLPAPAAHAWKGFAELLANGLDALPEGAMYAVVGGLALGILLPVLRKFAPDNLKNWVPSGLAVGIAFIVPAYYSIVMWAGSMAIALWKKLNPASAIAMSFAVASGLVAGEGLMGIGSALLQIAGVPNLWEFLDSLPK